MQRDPTPSATGSPAAVALPVPRGRAAALVRAARRRLGAERLAATRDALLALAVSRALVWAAGMFGLEAFGRSARWRGFDPAEVTAPYGWLGDLLVAPAARWDAVWYLAIANNGYPEPERAAFYPLYPLLIAAGGWVTGSRLVAGILISLALFGVALYLLRRLAALELGEGPARLCVWLVALFPASFAFSAIYSESLFLALSVGAVYAARRDRFWLASLLGGLAAATRSAGLVLLVALGLLYLYGPRGSFRRRELPGTGLRARLRPRFALRPDAVWLLLVPLGPIAFMLHLDAVGGDPLEPFRVQELWLRDWAGPFGGAWDGVIAAWDGARQLLSGSRSPVYFEPAGGDAFEVAGRNLALFGFLVLAVAATAGALRRLPPSYGLYAACALALPLSFPVSAEPLMSLPRFLAVLFPLFMWGALCLQGRRIAAPVALGLSAAGLAGSSAAFGAWEWVA
jgi:hypothetical protein